MLFCFLANLCTIAGVCLLTFAFTGMKRTAFFVTAFPLGMMWLYSRGWMRTKKVAVWAMIPTMLLILTTLFGYRWYCDPDAFFIALPQELRWPFYGVVATCLLYTSDAADE